MHFSCMQQNIQQNVILPQRVLARRSISGSNTLFNGILTTFNGILLNSYCPSVYLCKVL
jgi:hypothetical protein